MAEKLLERAPEVRSDLREIAKYILGESGSRTSARPVVSAIRACADSSASEHASRLAAMQVAQRNLDERLTEVTMQFRRARQEESRVNCSTS